MQRIFHNRQSEKLEPNGICNDFSQKNELVFKETILTQNTS